MGSGFLLFLLLLVACVWVDNALRALRRAFDQALDQAALMLKLPPPQDDSFTPLGPTDGDDGFEPVVEPPHAPPAGAQRCWRCRHEKACCTCH